MENVKFYYNNFLGEVVAIEEYKYDEVKKQMHYREVGQKTWVTDLATVAEPQVYDTRKECEIEIKKLQSLEHIKYTSTQVASLTILLSAIETNYDILDILHWKELRQTLGKDKCNTLVAALTWQDDDEDKSKQKNNDKKQENEEA